MKLLLSLTLAASVLVGCAPSATPTLPKGATACHTDWDCKDGEYCGFAGYNQYASCRPAPGTSHFDLPSPQ